MLSFVCHGIIQVLEYTRVFIIKGINIIEKMYYTDNSKRKMTLPKTFIIIFRSNLIRRKKLIELVIRA